MSLAALDEVLAVGAVPVPAAEVQRHDAGAGLDQAAGDAEVADHARRAVALERRVVDAVAGRRRCGSSLRQVERVGQLATTVRMPSACWVKASMPSIVPLVSSSRRKRSNEPQQADAVAAGGRA